MNKEIYDKGSRTFNHGAVSISAMSPEARTLLENALEQWSVFKQKLPEDCRESVFGFAYWLFRHSGLINYEKKPVKPPVKELICQRCELEYPVWFAPNELWNRVAREGEQFLCPTCFAVFAEERGVSTVRWSLTTEEIDKEDSFYKKLVTRGVETPETLRAAENIADLLCRLALGQVKDFAQIIHREVFPLMTQTEAAAAAKFFDSTAEYFRRVSSAEDTQLPDTLDLLYHNHFIRSWKTDTAYFYDIHRLFCVLSCPQADCGERIGIVKNCLETRRWGCGDQDPFKGDGNENF